MSKENPPAGVPQTIDSLSIDCTIFGFQESNLKVLLVKHAEGIIKDRWALPGGWVAYNEHLDDAAYRLLKDLTGVKELFLEQLKAFGEVGRYPGKRVITIGYYALTRPENYQLIPGFTASDARWFSINEIKDLPYDHSEILSFSWQRLKRKVKYAPIGFNLLPEKFTLLQLQELYESILEIKLDKPNFRRKIMKMDLIVSCHQKQQGVSHRAANLYHFDKKVYDQLTEDGFIFEF
ncbi:MAG: NUDIX hydrolase [Cyclobacteriaceae bacterium]|nr:NUDIX hydrolase [Cyclobacteriaceae bacterium]